MKNNNLVSLRRIAISLVAATLVFHSAAAPATPTEEMKEIQIIPALDAWRPERWDTGWTLRFDNDAFTGGTDDQDYSAGILLTYYGQRALQIGLLLFTPEDITAHEPNYDDRPFANLLYVAGSQISISPNATKAYQSTWTLGLLGSNVGQKVQEAVHDMTGAAEPNGWSNQVSDGGELTARYTVARHTLLNAGYIRRKEFDLKLTLEASIGYLTEGSAALALRWGRLQSPWWASTADYSSYASQPSPRGPRPLGLAQRRASYFSTGVRLRARAFNAFLQGQFRDSAVTLSTADLRPLLLEGWLGYTANIGRTSVQYALQYQSAEIGRGRGARDLVWASAMFSRSF